MTFPSTHPALGRALAGRDYNVPTPVQSAVLEANATGRDLLVSAQTGSGKTVAFGLAMARAVLGDAERLGSATSPLALIIAPTRELALQVQRELDWLYADTGARVITCVGGMDVRAEARTLHAGAHIVVGTPGRLRDHLERKRLDLSQLKTIVLDEADEMLDLGFREDLEVILEATPSSRQTLLFSATMPREIETLARRYQSEAVRIETLRRDQQHADIEYQAMRVGPGDVENAVVNVLRFHEVRSALVFCGTREGVKRLHGRLVERGFSAVALSGELTQHERTHALQAVRDGRARVLVATDVAARGLDLPDLALVIHADLPNDGETLLHRSGRTGRAGKKGLCTLIVPYSRRRKADTLLAAAKIRALWSAPPTVDAIRARDQTRFLADEIFTEPANDDDEQYVKALQAARTPDDIALALVRLHRQRLPAPEELPEDTGPPARKEFSRGRVDDARGRGEFARKDSSPSHRMEHGAGDERAPRKASHKREDTRAMVWFRLNIGRDRNADPRWLLPLICKAGGVTKPDIGTIKINDRDTRFQIVAELADQFEASARTAKTKEGHISRASASSDGSAGDALGIDGGAPMTLQPTPYHSTGDRNPTERSSPRTPPARFEGKPSWRDAKKKPDRTASDGSSPQRFGGSKPEPFDRSGAKTDAAKSHASPGQPPKPYAPNAGKPSPFGKFSAKKKHRGAPAKNNG